MIYTIISDIHGNLAALNAFFDFYRKQGLKSSKIICAGDIVGYGPAPSQCLKLIRSTTDIIINGNHERMLLNPNYRRDASHLAVEAIEWVERILRPEELSFIARLPENIKLDPSIYLIHGSPEDPDEYIFTSESALRGIRVLKKLEIRRAIVGHTHVPGVFDQRGAKLYKPGIEVKLDPEQYYIINPGSIGQPRDGDPRGSFCVMDSDNLAVNFYRFEYDIDLTAKQISKAGLPIQLAHRLFNGI